ncbi:aminoglycoside N(3)-acetyltransferase [Cohnella thailandensis]|uniref:Aminoglycoside N(3)-acetyltransferase n=1 Tax=Cohnella thailandensis TaxID=557557 RepID=A0A841T207_9BACL|nr:AAC(3) family N-acetyltransferase [Cohnella thailandensis]MBB6637079.1 AAC(3) family N-acetyltransferase [Cohnella thailandensis]MBP1973031.1 aminoglycoside 3-N-acetyltransferase [Cohnella thailandensis]
MSEKEIIERTRQPNTVSSMTRQLGQLGVRQGDTLLVHSSLSRLGWVCGGPQAVIQALLMAVGEEGTIVMPAQSGHWNDPAGWRNPGVPAEWLETIYREMPAFDPALTPTSGMGQIAELFRTWPGTLRSSHPQVSFAANGKHAADIVSEHPLTPQFGADSPLGRLYELEAKVLLLGAGYDSCTCMHLAETKIPGMPRKRKGTAMMAGKEREWRWFEDFEYDADDFDQIGLLFDRSGRVASGRIGEAECKLFGAREAVDAAEKWLRANRRYDRG